MVKKGHTGQVSLGQREMVKSHQKKEIRGGTRNPTEHPGLVSEAGGSGLEARRTYEALKEESGKWVEFRDIYIIHAALKKRPQVGESGA